MLLCENTYLQMIALDGQCLKLAGSNSHSYLQNPSWSFSYSSDTENRNPSWWASPWTSWFYVHNMPFFVFQKWTCDLCTQYAFFLYNELWFLPLLWGVCNTPCGLATLLDSLIWGPSLFLISFTGPMITHSVATQSTNPIAILPSKQFKLNLTLTILQNPHQCKILEFFWVKISMIEKKVKIWKKSKKNLQK
jgi:hypothetical protein